MPAMSTYPSDMHGRLAGVDCAWRCLVTRLRRKALTSVDDAGERKGSLVDDAYTAIRAAIRDVSFAPGYQVRVLPRKGILILALAPDDLREIYDVVIALEGQAAELIASMNEADRILAAGTLDVLTDEMARAQMEGDRPAWGDADGAFHAALIEKALNRRMSRIIQSINDQSHRARALTLNLRRGLETSIDEHRLIASTIRAGDRVGALQAARGHRARARDELLPLLQSCGLKHL